MHPNPSQVLSKLDDPTLALTYPNPRALTYPNPSQVLSKLHDLTLALTRC